MNSEPIWTEWMENPGAGECPVPDFALHVQAEYSPINTDGEITTLEQAMAFSWVRHDVPGDITSYRYAVPADLAWLAENVSEWPWCIGDANRKLDESRGHIYTAADGKVDGYTKDQWLRARRDLGYESQGNYVPGKMSMPRWGREMSEKQARYIDDNGEDWIDEFARTATPEEFRGAMRFTIGKYNRRAGKKDDLVKEIRKMRDYCDRWLEYEGDV